MNIKKQLYAFVLPLLLFAGQLFAQERVVTGRVTDSSGAPVANASVLVRGTSTGTQTAADGTFSVRVPSNNSRLVISSVGFGVQEVAATATVNIRLQAANSALGEVVVVGYGTVRKRDLTGSVATISSKDFQKGTITSPEQLIAGKVAGVQITSAGGAPGSGSTIRIRGGASLNATNDPLIVIDGIPLAFGDFPGSANPLNLINPNDIESFNILKDASAAAIYGSRASNGVIIITTKKGTRGTPRFNFNTQVSAGTVSKKADIFSADEFRKYVTANDPANFKQYLGNANTDWQDQIYQTAITTDNNLSVSGSLKNLPYRISGNYMKQQGILKTGYMERGSLSINATPTLINNHLKIDLNVKGAVTGNRFAPTDAIGAAVSFNPTYPVMSGSKNLGGYFEYPDPSAPFKALAPRNPLGLLEQRIDKGTVRRAIASALFDYRVHFLPDLHINVNLGYDITKGFGRVLVTDSAASDYYAYTPNGQRFGGVNNYYQREKENKLLETYLSYGKDLKSINSRIDAVAGYSYQNFLTKFYNYPNYTYSDTLIPSSVPTYATNRENIVLLSYYGRLNYSYKSKYLLTAAIRTDGSSRFAPSERWGVFPAVAAAWSMKQESFLRNSRTVSELKLRAGYGKTGQQEGIGLYDFISFYNLSSLTASYQLGDNFYQMYRPGGYYPQRTWETTTTYNTGLDYGFFNNRINGTLEFYYKKTTGLLNTVTQAAGTNFVNQIVANVGEMENKGVELVVNTNIIRRSDFKWDVSINGTYNRNRITKLTVSPDPNYTGIMGGDISGGTGSQILISSVGYSRDAFYVLKQVYDLNGHPIENLFSDLNRDGKINEKDFYRYKSAAPQFFLGFSTNVTYRKWNAGLVMRANLDNYVYNNVFSNTGTQNNIFNTLGYLNNGSRNVVETGFTGSLNNRFSDYYVQNASFLRLDNLNVGYNAGKLFNKTTVRLNANIQNLFTITKYKGLDPEISNGIDRNFYPRPRTYTLGVNLDF